MAGSLRLEGKLRQQAQEMLLKVGRIFNNAKLEYVLEGGTLLGVIRENRLLPWDNDMDITIMEDQIPVLLKTRKALWRAGYRTRLRYYKEDVGPFKKGEIRMMKIQTRKWFIFKDKSLLDIFIKREKDGLAYWSVSARNPVLKSVEAKFYRNRSFCRFLGEKFAIPQQTKEYLTYRYGDWKTPKKKWNFKKDDQAIVKKIGEVM
ncbi:MAG: LicD family protein [Candidatus Cloacimonetes bacterium]|nr:LicD family protein [Candidatus Cloacimonadota bacterium]